MFDGIMQPTHLILILIVVLIVFGPGKLPEAGKAMGKMVREFRRATSGALEEKEEPKPAGAPAAAQLAEATEKK
ncbi:twin-arginine translocase TatA/TatE family subunit [Desulfotomaculum copahuensis]|uniref:Sec-independent protein translocase protein TatA n=1 Tax=Desulfotomaculum copahuensis TaxID=1838280 RepID=A0A1B7LC54_9FIRM|nr:twin-arginine translocase TatA/TatE family subunit [Desulfotomaculum copahuensis]OAT80230.1 preprotein translocase [Desulfotomaculum copahuensis]